MKTITQETVERAREEFAERGGKIISLPPEIVLRQTFVQPLTGMALINGLVAFGRVADPLDWEGEEDDSTSA